jgi:hypothetical protein
LARKPPAQAPASRQIEFRASGRTRIQVAFDEPDLSSDGGAVLLRETARVNRIIPALAAALRDGRRRPSPQYLSQGCFVVALHTERAASR